MCGGLFLYGGGAKPESRFLLAGHFYDRIMSVRFYILPAVLRQEGVCVRFCYCTAGNPVRSGQQSMDPPVHGTSRIDSGSAGIFSYYVYIE